MPDKQRQALLEQMTAIALRQLGAERGFASLTASPAIAPATRPSVVDRIVFIGLSRRSAGEHFKELRRHQVELIGNRPAPSLLHEFLPGLSGCIPVLTCCRFELHGLLSPESETPSDDELLDGFSALLHLPNSMRSLLRVRRGIDAIRHLVWTGLGGESILLGETEITAQLKTAYRYALADGHLRRAPELHSLYQRAFHTIHSLRDRFGITGGWATSLERLAFERLRAGLLSTGASPRPEDWHIGIVGAGRVATQLAAVCQREGMPLDRIVFYVRNRERAMANPAFPEGAEARLLPLLAEDLRAGRIDGIFGAVTHPLSVLQDAELWGSLPRACHAVDLSVPPMFDPAKFIPPASLLKYVGFDELMAQQGERLDSVHRRLAEVECEVVAVADRLAAHLVRREALRSLPLEATRRVLRERLTPEPGHALPEIEHLLDEALDAKKMSTREGERQRQRLRRRLHGVIRHQAIQALKDSLIPDAPPQKGAGA